MPAGVTVAARNGPRLVTLAGPREFLDEVGQALATSGVTGRLLRVPHAMHSAALDAPAEKFASFMATVPVAAPAIPFLSNVTGTWITEEEIRTPGYWAAQMREPVQFEQGLANLLARTNGPLVETGPGRGMLSLAQAAGPERLVQTLASASDGRDDLQVLHEAFAALWESGTELSWSAFAGDGRRTPLPTYPFQRKRYWTDPAADRPADRPAENPGPAADKRDELGAALEAELNGAFRRVLGAEHIESADNFFALGGNSLLALDLIEHVRRDYRVKIPLRDFFSVPTIEGLASLVAAAKPQAAAEPQAAAIGEQASD